MTISARLAQLITDKGIRQKDIAEVCNVRPSTVNTWIKTNSESIPSAYIIPISQFLNISPIELLGGDPCTATAAIPDDYVQLNDTEKKLITVWRELEWEGQIVVMNAAISEHRAVSMKGNGGNGESSQEVG